MLSSTRQKDTFLSHQTFPLLRRSRHPRRHQNKAGPSRSVSEISDTVLHDEHIVWWMYHRVRHEWLWHWVTVYVNSATPALPRFEQHKPSKCVLASQYVSSAFHPQCRRGLPNGRNCSSDLSFAGEGTLQTQISMYHCVVTFGLDHCDCVAWLLSCSAVTKRTCTWGEGLGTAEKNRRIKPIETLFFTRLLLPKFYSPPFFSSYRWPLKKRSSLLPYFLLTTITTKEGAKKKAPLSPPPLRKHKMAPTQEENGR